MKVLILNQAFYPDVVSTAQHARDLAVRLAEAGHEVTVVASRRAYDSPERRFESSEIWKGIRICRVTSFGLGKTAKWRRALDFGSFLANSVLAVARMPGFDVVIGMTSPPLIAFVGSLLVRMKGGKLVYWVMDLNPDEAIAAGWLRSDSYAARVLTWISKFTLRTADKVIVLDRFMKERVLSKGISPETVEVIPPWSHDDAVHQDKDGSDAFRRQHGLIGKFVIMYSGNHSPCHPLDSLVAAARRLANNSQIVFCFIGGGSEHARVRQIAEREGLENVRCLPYQPIERLSASLKSADVHVVVMGDPFVGIVHPCKIYNVLRLGMPVLYIGPSEGHVPDMVSAGTAAPKWFRSAFHGEVDLIMEHIAEFVRNGPGTSTEQQLIAARFTEKVLLTRMIDAVESLAAPSGSPKRQVLATR